MVMAGFFLRKLTDDLYERLPLEPRPSRPHPDLTRVDPGVVEVSLEQAQGPVPEVVEGKGYSGLIDGNAVLDPGGLQFVEGLGVGDTLKFRHSSSLRHLEVLWRDDDLGRDVSIVITSENFQISVGRGLLLTKLSIGSSSPKGVRN